MRFQERVILLAARIVPKSRRETRREEWLADLEGSAELGIGTWTVPLGALRYAATASNLRAHITHTRPRTWVALATSAAAIILLAIPGVGIAAYAVEQLRGVVTSETAPDGTTFSVHWRDYPATAQAPAADVLTGPSLEEGLLVGESLVAQLRDGLDERLSLSWAEEDYDGTVRRTTNGYGGTSMLYVVNAPAWLATSAPLSGRQIEESIALITEIGAQSGFTEPVIHQDAADAGTDFVSGILSDDAGQWIAFTIGELPVSGDQAPAPSITLAYGANGLLAENDRAEFEERAEPFTGYEMPEPLES